MIQSYSWFYCSFILDINGGAGWNCGDRSVEADDLGIDEHLLCDFDFDGNTFSILRICLSRRTLQLRFLRVFALVLYRGLHRL